MTWPGAGEIGKVENLAPAVHARKDGDAGLFANLRQRERPKIFEKTGISHNGSRYGARGGIRAARDRYFLGAAGFGAFRFILKAGSFWFSRLMASPVMSKPWALANTTACLSRTRLAPRSLTSCCRMGPSACSIA